MFQYDKIIHLTPEYPPHVGGVADFAFIVKESMNEWNVAQEVIIAGIKPTQLQDHVHIHKTNGGAELVQLICTLASESNTLLVLHYVCYGYSLKGIPFFLPRALQRIKGTCNITVLTYFHELYATESSPLKSAFWLGFIQKKLAQKISYLSDIRITTSVSYKTELDSWNRDSVNRNLYLPVFSNIPEYPNWMNIEKQPHVVVFGSRGARNKVYRDAQLLSVMMAQTNKYKWLDIGMPIDCHSSIQCLGSCSDVEVSKILASASLGFIQYDDMPIEKSGVFAAYILNGVVPIVINCNRTESAYVAGVDYILFEDFENVSQEQIYQIRINAYKKYKELASIEMHHEKTIHFLTVFGNT